METSLSQTSARRKTAASPISNVSTEILSIFFREAFLHKSTRASMVVSHVSRHWREVAIHDPVLWSTVRLTPHGESPFDRLCLERSKQCDLEVCYEDQCEYELDEEEIKPFSHASLYLDRCHTLQLLFADRTGAFTVLRDLKSASAPKLVSFEIILDGKTEHWTNPGRPGDVFLGGAPLLTCVTLHGISPLECHLPLEKITELTLKASGPHSEQYPDLYPSEFVDILREVAPTLQTLLLDGSQVFEHDDYPWAAVELPVLLSLDIGNMEEEHREECEEFFENFWQFLSTPSLEDLSLHDLSASQVQNAWSAFKGQRGAKVKSLSLSDLAMEEVDDDLDEIFPNISGLALTADMISIILPSLVDADKEHKSTGAEPELPLLQCITLMDCINDVDVGLVCSFILGRESVGCRIKKIEFHGRKLAYSALQFAHKHAEQVTVEGGMPQLREKRSGVEGGEGDSDESSNEG